MKIFEDRERYNNKVNFVDENNVLVGYDMNQCCCEDAGYFISDNIHKQVGYDTDISEFSVDVDMAPYFFDTKFYDTYDWEWTDEGGAAVFRLIDGEKELFLHLYNCHNGYYGHGFEMKLNDEVIHEGGL